MGLGLMNAKLATMPWLPSRTSVCTEPSKLSSFSQAEMQVSRIASLQTCRTKRNPGTKEVFGSNNRRDWPYADVGLDFVGLDLSDRCVEANTSLLPSAAGCCWLLLAVAAGLMRMWAWTLWAWTCQTAAWKPIRHCYQVLRAAAGCFWLLLLALCGCGLGLCGLGLVRPL